MRMQRYSPGIARAYRIPGGNASSPKLAQLH